MSTHQACVDGVVTILKALALDGIGQNVFAQLVEAEGNLVYPYLLVKFEDEAEAIENFTSGSRLFLLPVHVELVDRIAGPAAERLPGWADARQAIIEAFPDRRRSGLPVEVHGCDVLPEAAIRNEGRAYQKGSGGLVLMFKATRAT